MHAIDRVVRVRILTEYARAGASHKGWYEETTKHLREFSRNSGYPIEQVAAVFSILSPRVRVSTNYNLLRKYFFHKSKGHESPSEMMEVMRSTRSALYHWERTGAIRGPKTSAFCRALLGDPNAVVLDLWMARALGVEQSTLSRKKVYDTNAALVASVADILQMTPAQAQAAIWFGVSKSWHSNPFTAKQEQTCLDLW